MIIFYAGLAKEAFFAMIFVNLFFLLASIAVGLYMTKKERQFETGIFADDFKTAMQSGLVYAIAIAGFIYLYHNSIDPSIREAIIEDITTALHEAVPDEATYAKLQETDNTWQEKSYDDYIENQEDQIDGFISPLSIFVVHLMGLSMLSFFYAFGTTFILRKIVLKGL